MTRLKCAIGLILALGVAGPVPAQTSGFPVGRTEWTNPDASGRPPGNAARPLVPRTRIVEREAVSTSDRGAADFFFVNRSRLLVGPSCRVVLDGRFYDAELDTEVKAFTLGTLMRCITKAENVLADEPKDRITVATPRGTIVIAGAVATIALSADDAASGLPLRGNPVSAPLQVTVSALRPGGFVSLTGADGQTGNSGVIRRPGFVLWVDEFGEVRGPDRETPQKAAQLRAPLTDAVSQTASASSAPLSSTLAQDFVLANPDRVRPIELDDRRLLLPAENCLAEGCEGLFVTP